MITPGSLAESGTPESREYIVHRLSLTRPLRFPTKLAKDYSWSLWRPTLDSVAPEGFQNILLSVAWSIMHYARIFRNRDYGILVVRHDQTLVHHTVLFPSYLRFPFMGQDDLNIGETWTDPAHREKGLATFAVRKAVELTWREGRTFWYAHLPDNVASQRVCRRADFQPIGRARKVTGACGNMLARIELVADA